MTPELTTAKLLWIIAGCVLGIGVLSGSIVAAIHACPADDRPWVLSLIAILTMMVLVVAIAVAGNR